jgi:hypothetical protein
MGRWSKEVHNSQYRSETETARYVDEPGYIGINITVPEKADGREELDG